MKRSMKKTVFAALLLCAVIAVAGLAAAEPGTAPDITQWAEIRLSKYNSQVKVLTDGDYKTDWRDERGAFAEFTLPADHPCHTLYILTSGDPEKLIVEEDRAGSWQRVPIEGERFNTHTIPLEGLTHFRVRVTRDKLRILEVRLFGQGKLPPDVVDYHHVADKADLMVLACHPDDDILWMGGLMPTYAGQLGMKVQLVYMTSRFHYRRCEAMDALWHSGVRQGPVFLGLPDSVDAKRDEALAMWGDMDEAALKIARQIRRFRPEVLVTQDVNGEYGHVQHRIMAAACTRAVKMAADPKNRRLRDLPAWEVKKYYMHLYHKNKVVLDMERPLSAFGGKTAFEVAKEAFLMHKSQQSGRVSVNVDGPYDMRRFGLAHTAVGPDERDDRLFEHIEGLEDLEREFYDGQTYRPAAPEPTPRFRFSTRPPR